MQPTCFVILLLTKCGVESASLHTASRANSLDGRESTITVDVEHVVGKDQRTLQIAKKQQLFETRKEQIVRKLMLANRTRNVLDGRDSTITMDVKHVAEKKLGMLQNGKTQNLFEIRKEQLVRKLILVNRTQVSHPDHYFSQSDLAYFDHWSERSKYQSMPRVLLYTWQTPDCFDRYPDETHWKICYSKSHGFDVLFDDTPANTNVKHANASQWYSDTMMWAWTFAIKQHLMSGQYDYVLLMGADVKIQEKHLDFPVWLYDTGHDLTVMDQDYFSWGLNENALLFKANSWSLQFLTAMQEHSKYFNLQGDNGPYMETILTSLGREAEAEGRPGYGNACLPKLRLDVSSSEIGKEKYLELNKIYSGCFFHELQRLAGPFGARSSKHIGFSSTSGPKPWANCWSKMREYPDWRERCFALHWNGPKPKHEVHHVQGSCPDKTFQWSQSPYFRP